jgi:hypothetical protein
MDSGKILLAKLPEGLLGRENSYLLGTLLVAKFQQTAMSRQARQIEARRMFSIVIDEFANFITPSMAEILSGARKYRIGLTLAHHELQQLQRSPEVASAVLTHPYTRIVFRVGDDDAKKLAEGFSYFEAQDLRNLETGQAVVRVERSDFDFNLTVPLPDGPDKDSATVRRQEVITVSRRKYAMLRTDVEAMLARQRTTSLDTQPTTPQAKPEPKPPVLPVAQVVSEPPQVAEPQKLSEIPKESAPHVTEPKPPEASRTLVPLGDLGRGGAQHQAIQRRIKEAAEKLNFRCIIERPVLDGQGSVDLWLERDGQAVACEISISTTIDHEVRNVGKCLKAGVPKVAVICLDDGRLRKIEMAVSGSFGAEPAARVGYFQPDRFIAWLKTLPAEIPKEKTVQRRGYKIKTVLAEVSMAEQKEKETAAIRAVASAMRRL